MKEQTEIQKSLKKIREFGEDIVKDSILNGTNKEVKNLVKGLPKYLRNGLYESLGITIKVKEPVVYYSYIKSPKWKTLRDNFIEKHPSCIRCKTNKRLVLHHATYENVGKEKEKELYVLCNSCHKELHIEYNREHGSIDNDSLFPFTIYFIHTKRKIKKIVPLKPQKDRSECKTIDTTYTNKERTKVIKSFKIIGKNYKITYRYAIGQNSSL